MGVYLCFRNTTKKQYLGCFLTDNSTSEGTALTDKETDINYYSNASSYNLTEAKKSTNHATETLVGGCYYLVNNNTTNYYYTIYINDSNWPAWSFNGPILRHTLTLSSYSLPLLEYIYVDADSKLSGFWTDNFLKNDSQATGLLQFSFGKYIPFVFTNTIKSICSSLTTIIFTKTVDTITTSKTYTYGTDITAGTYNGLPWFKPTTNNEIEVNAKIAESSGTKTVTYGTNCNNIYTYDDISIDTGDYVWYPEITKEMCDFEYTVPAESQQYLVNGTNRFKVGSSATLCISPIIRTDSTYAQITQSYQAGSSVTTAAITVTQRVLQIAWDTTGSTLNGNVYEYTYDKQPHLPTPIFSNLVTETVADSFSYTMSQAAVTDVVVTNGVITNYENTVSAISSGSAANYTLTGATGNSCNFKIMPFLVTLIYTPDNLQYNNQTKNVAYTKSEVYDTTDLTFGLTYDTDSRINVSTFYTTVTIGGTKASNYTFISGSNTLSETKPWSITKAPLYYIASNLITAQNNPKLDPSFYIAGYYDSSGNAQTIVGKNTYESTTAGDTPWDHKVYLKYNDTADYFKATLTLSSLFDASVIGKYSISITYENTESWTQNYNLIPKDGLYYIKLAVSNAFPTKFQPYTHFYYNNEHSSAFKIYRTSNSNRYNDNLTATIKPTTLTINGRDGSQFAYSTRSTRTFTVNYAFDSLKDDDLSKLSQWLGDKKIHELVFDELPFKAYCAKVTGTAQIKTVQVSVNNENCYCGTGSITFTCYYPFAHSKWWTGSSTTLAQYRNEGSWRSCLADPEIWSSVAHIPEAMTNGTYVNTGEAPTNFTMDIGTLPTVNNSSFKKGGYIVIYKKNVSTEVETQLAKLVFQEDLTPNASINWDSETGIVKYTLNNDIIYVTGSQFQLPTTAYTTNASTGSITTTETIVFKYKLQSSDTSESEFDEQAHEFTVDYNYLYY